MKPVAGRRSKADAEGDSVGVAEAGEADVAAPPMGLEGGAPQATSKSVANTTDTTEDIACNLPRRTTAWEPILSVAGQGGRG
jgi:hypothetical protein